MTHTPGPWTVVTYENLGKLHILQTADQTVFSHGENLLDEDDFRTASNNARVASCAPEMLEALKDICTELNDIETISPPTYERIKALIKRAEGGQS